MPETIEDIILSKDMRGIAALRPYLPPDYCAQAAQYVLDHPGPVVITTGFYILAAGACETDGPPGAIAIGEALESLGRRVFYLTDRYGAPLLAGCLGDNAPVIEFPIDTPAVSRAVAQDLAQRLQPALLISIERCGRTSDDKYLNMRAADITPHTARLDYLFERGVPSVGVGDGGNEIGMGNLAEVIPTVETLPKDPAVTRVDRLVIASVSNWGGYGLVAALSRLTGRDLLPTAAEQNALVKRIIDLGGVDGTTGRAEYTVDGFSLEEHGEALAQLRGMVG